MLTETAELKLHKFNIKNFLNRWAKPGKPLSFRRQLEYRSREELVRRERRSGFTVKYYIGIRRVKGRSKVFVFG